MVPAASRMQSAAFSFFPEKNNLPPEGVFGSGPFGLRMRVFEEALPRLMSHPY
jgi:hypothetical protein